MKPTVTFNGKPIDRNTELWGDANVGIVQHSPKDKPLPLSEETKELLAWAKKGDKS